MTKNLARQVTSFGKFHQHMQHVRLTPKITAMLVERVQIRRNQMPCFLMLQLSTAVRHIGLLDLHYSSHRRDDPFGIGNMLKT